MARNDISVLQFRWVTVGAAVLLLPAAGALAFSDYQAALVLLGIWALPALGLWLAGSIRR